MGRNAHRAQRLDASTSTAARYLNLHRHHAACRPVRADQQPAKAHLNSDHKTA